MKALKKLTLSTLLMSLTLPLYTYGEEVANAIPISNGFPDCDFETIEEISLSDSRNELSALKKTASDVAKKRGASQIVLLSKLSSPISPSEPSKNSDKISGAALISSCKKEPLAKIGVERNRLLGTTKLSMSYEYNTVIKGRDMTFDFAEIAQSGKKQIQAPALANTTVSFENGVFGLKVGDDLSVLFEKLGTPAAELILNKQDTLYAFGRNLWVVMRNNSVFSISSENAWLSAGLINYFEFDDRPLSSWQVNGSISRGHSLKAIEEQLNGKLIDEYVYQIKSENMVFIDIGLTLRVENNDTHYVAKSFGYGYGYEAIKIDPEIIQSAPEIYSRTYADLTKASETLDPISMEQIPFKPILASRGYEGKTLHVYDKSLAIVYSNKMLRKVLISESFLKDAALNIDWEFGPLRYGLSEEDVKKIFGEENIFALGDYWEVYVDNLKYDLYFAKNKQGTTILSELEIEMF